MAPADPRPEAAADAAPARARPRRRVARLLGAAAAVLLLIVLSHPWWLAPAASRYFSGTSGRAVQLESIRLGLTATLAPVVRLHGVRIANAPWADSTRPFAVFEDAEFEFAWLPRDGRRVVSRVALSNGEVNLERHPDGRRNWRLRNPEDRGPGHHWFLVLEPDRTVLSFVHPAAALVLRATSSPVTPLGDAPAGTALPIRVDFDGTFRKVAFRGSTASAQAISLLKSGVWFSLRGHLDVEGVRIELDGRAADILREPRLDVALRLAGKSLAALGPVLDGRYPEPRPFRVAGRLTLDPERAALAGATASVGATDLAGDVAWSRGAKPRTLRAGLKSESTDFADLAWLAGRAAPAAARAASAARPALVAAGVAASAPASAPRGLARARDWDAELSFAARRFRAADAKMVQSLALKAKLQGGMLELSALDVGLAGGHATGSVGVDLREALPAGDAKLAWRGIRIESLLAAQDEKRRITGALHGRASLKAKGDSVDELLASASGSASVELAGGTIASMLDAQLALQGGKVVRTLLSGSEPLPLPCAAGAIDVRGGKARIKSLVVDSANTRTVGSGTIDLGERTIDLVLTPEPKKRGLLDLDRSIRLHGRLDKPERALVDRVAQPAAGACQPAAAR